VVDNRAVTCNFVIVEPKDGADRAAVAAIQDRCRGLDRRGGMSSMLELSIQSPVARRERRLRLPSAAVD